MIPIRPKNGTFYDGTAALNNKRERRRHTQWSELPRVRRENPPGGFFKRGNGRPDFILSETPPTKITGRGAIVVGEIKLSGNRFYLNYVAPCKKKKQLDAICDFASRHVMTDTAVFLTIRRGDKGNWQKLGVELLGQGLRKHVVLVLYSATKK